MDIAWVLISALRDAQPLPDLLERQVVRQHREHPQLRGGERRCTRSRCAWSADRRPAARPPAAGRTPRSGSPPDHPGRLRQQGAARRRRRRHGEVRPGQAEQERAPRAPARSRSGSGAGSRRRASSWRAVPSLPAVDGEADVRDPGRRRTRDSPRPGRRPRRAPASASERTRRGPVAAVHRQERSMTQQAGEQARGVDAASAASDRLLQRLVRTRRVPGVSRAKASIQSAMSRQALPRGSSSTASGALRRAVVARRRAPCTARRIARPDSNDAVPSGGRPANEPRSARSANRSVLAGSPTTSSPRPRARPATAGPAARRRRTRASQRERGRSPPRPVVADHRRADEDRATGRRRRR